MVDESHAINIRIHSWNASQVRKRAARRRIEREKRREKQQQEQQNPRTTTAANIATIER